MGNGHCKQCKCNNCDNKEKKIADNFLEQNLDIIKNDAYESFDNELKNNNLEENNYNKIVQPSKNMENEKNTTNNNQENITDNRKDKGEIENNNSINNNDKNETVNNININCIDKENKNDELEKLKMKKENYNEEKSGNLIKFDNNIHIVNFNKKKVQKNNNINDINDMNEINENIEKNKNKKKKNNNDEFNIINNDLVYITNKNNNINDNLEYNNYSKENQYNSNNNDNDINYDNHEINNFDNNYNGNYYDKNNMVNKESSNILNIKKIINIYSIIPKKKILKLNDNSIICNSILEKIIKIPEKNKIIYNERFCVLTKKNFSYYKSKENYLNLTKPLLSIDLKNIIKVEQTILDDTSYYFGLICSINDSTRKYIDKINTFINIGENNDEEFLLGFRAKNKDLIIKWIVILNYFIDNYE